MSRLTKGSISLADIYALSKKNYKVADDKKRRANLDIVSARITSRNNMKYNRATGLYEQTGRESRITIRVKSKPVSYERIDTVKNHMYDVTFLFRDISMGIHSPFKWRTGSLKKPIFAKKGASKKERIKIANKNIRNGVQLDAVFRVHFVAKLWGCLYGPCYATYAPNKTNKQMVPAMSKTAFFVTKELIIPLLKSGKAAAIGRSIKNPNADS